jgi:type VI secretion system protein ImpE
MGPEESLRQGDLDGALERLQAQIRAKPAELKPRIFLFQLLCVLGDWKRALTQLKVAAGMDATVLPMAQTYSTALDCERFRAEVFAGQRSPLILGKPPPWTALMLEALKATAESRHRQSAELRTQAFDLAPAIRGTVNDKAFDWIADADMRLGPVVEAIINQAYYWVPFEHVRAIRLEEPSDLRDFVWTPAHFTWANGGETLGLIPTRYPGSESDPDPEIKLGRKTLWDETYPGFFTGRGQRLLSTDRDEIALLDLRSLELEVTPDTGEA